MRLQIVHTTRYRYTGPRWLLRLIWRARVLERFMAL